MDKKDRLSLFPWLFFCWYFAGPSFSQVAGWFWLLAVFWGYVLARTANLIERVGAKTANTAPNKSVLLECGFLRPRGKQIPTFR